MSTTQNKRAVAAKKANEPTTEAPQPEVKFEAPEGATLFVDNAAEILSAYLAAEASTDEVGTVELPKPYVSKDGRVYVHSRHMLKWAKREHGRKIEKKDVQALLRSLGLTVRAMPLPGLKKSAGFYQGKKPKGVVLKDVPVRDRRGKTLAEAAVDGSDEHDAAVKSGN